MAKSERKLSLIAFDHGHEQNNAIMKEEGGFIGLTLMLCCAGRLPVKNLCVQSPSLNRQLEESHAILVHDTMNNQRPITSVWQHRFNKI